MRLEVKNLSVVYSPHRSPVHAVKDVSLSVEAGGTLGIVGESGSGKSTMGLAIMRLLPGGVRVRGAIELDGQDILSIPEKAMRRLRGRRIGMVFQDSLAALNPVFTIQSQLVDTIQRHDPTMDRRSARRRAGEMLEEMGISADRLRNYPHQFSGGMRQRVMIAAALAPGPDFLIADESTSDLDTVSQRQILDLLQEVARSRNLGLIVVSHDLGVIHHLCNTVAVMYHGDLVEYGPTKDVLIAPKHWYTKGLVAVSAKEFDESGRLRTMHAYAASAREQADA